MNRLHTCVPCAYPLLDVKFDDNTCRMTCFVVPDRMFRFFSFFFRKPDADEQTLDMLVVKVSKLQSHRTIRLGSALQENELQDKTVQLPFCAGALAAHASRQAPHAETHWGAAFPA